MELMQHIPDKSVDMILCDLPYGTTACEWDKVLPLDELWKQYKRILKEDGVVVLTASQPFTTDLINSNRDWFRYEIIWMKSRKTNFANVNNMPLKSHENILVFYKKLPTHNQTNLKKLQKPVKSWRKNGKGGNLYDNKLQTDKKRLQEYTNYNESVIKFNNEHNVNAHPTQKPVELFRYLIKTYTNEGELVLDNCIGSGTTAVACKQANRNFIGIELSQEYVDIANKRLQQDNLHAFFQTQGVLTEPSPNRN
jgi:site-specific DNA-methyltransferase (adenine-specific)